MDALHCALAAQIALQDLVNKIAVAADAAFLQNSSILGFDHDRLVEVHEGEALRVAIAVVCLGDVFADELVRQMTVNAPSDRMVGPAAPGCVLLIHYMAVPARAGVGGEVAQAFAVLERVRSETCESTDEDGGDQSQPAHLLQVETIAEAHAHQTPLLSQPGQAP